jgi:hypothetical protein
VNIIINILIPAISTSKAVVIRIMPFELVLLRNWTSWNLSSLAAWMMRFRRLSFGHLLMQILQILTGSIILAIVLSILTVRWQPIFGGPHPIVLLIILLNLPLSVLAHWNVLPIWILHFLIRILPVHVQIELICILFSECLCLISLVPVHNKPLGLFSALFQDIVGTSYIHVLLPHLLIHDYLILGLSLVEVGELVNVMLPLFDC